MEKDILIEKFFTQSINDSEKEQLNYLLESDPSFKAEFDSIANFNENFEQQVGNADSIISKSDINFLEFAKNNFIQATLGVAASATIASTVTNTTTIGKLTSLVASNSLYLGAASAVLIGSLATYIAIKNPDQSQSQNKIIRKELIQIPKAEFTPEVKNTQTSPVSPKVIEKKTEVNSTKPIENNNNTQSIASNELDAKGTITETKSTNIDESLQLKIAELENKIALNDFQNAAILSKTIALTYKLKSGFANEAKIYYFKTIELSNKSKLTELEAESYGEIAIIDYNQGDLTSFNKNKENCLSILQNINSKKINIWKDKLNK